MRATEWRRQLALPAAASILFPLTRHAPTVSSLPLLPLRRSPNPPAPSPRRAWTRRSALGVAGEDDFQYDMDAPPDVFAAAPDGKARGLTSLHEKLRGAKRIFVCGLVTDFCVMDTCLNAVELGFAEVYMVLDAARAAHIPGLGAFGGGFLSDPQEVKAKCVGAGVRFASVEGVTGTPPLAARAGANPFPGALGPLPLAFTTKLSLAVKDGVYTVSAGLNAALVAALGGEAKGPCSPPAPLPPTWPGAPAEASRFCWAYPLEGVAKLGVQWQLAFLDVSASPSMQLAAYGGFLLLDDAGAVVATQAIAGSEDGFQIAFAPPRPWRDDFTGPLREASRLQPVTLPNLKARRRELLLDPPGREPLLRPREVPPAADGAFLYLMQGGGAIWFPVVPPKKLKHASSKGLTHHV